jgi:hypothetical protein
MMDSVHQMPNRANLVGSNESLHLSLPSWQPCGCCFYPSLRPFFDPIVALFVAVEACYNPCFHNVSAKSVAIQRR